MKNIFITGANGLIGSYLVQHFIKEGYTVHALYRTSSDIAYLWELKNQIHWHEGDIFDTLLLIELFKDIDMVIHAAAMVSFHYNDRKKMYETNVVGTANIVNACLETGVKKLCYISSVASLGRKKGETEINELSKWEDNEKFTYYGQTKYLAELEVQRGVAEGLDAFIVCPSVVLGVGDWRKSSLRLFEYVQKQTPFYTSGWINYVDVRDVTHCIALLLEQGRAVSGERFILNAGVTTYKNLFMQIANRLQKKAPQWLISNFWLMFISRFLRLLQLLTGIRPNLTPETAQAAIYQFSIANEKVKKQINYSFLSLEQTLDWVIETGNQQKEPRYLGKSG